MRFLCILYIVDKSCTLINLYNFIVNRTKYVAQNTPPPLSPATQILSLAVSLYEFITHTLLSPNGN